MEDGWDAADAFEREAFDTPNRPAFLAKAEAAADKIAGKKTARVTAQARSERDHAQFGRGVREQAQISLQEDGVPAGVPSLKDFVRGLRRLGACRPSWQAKPATWNQTARAVELERHGLTRLALLVGRGGASRVADVTTLVGRDVEFIEGAGHVAINWYDTKSDPFRLGQTTGSACRTGRFGRLRARVAQIQPDQLVFGRPKGAPADHPGTSYSRISAALKRVDKALTGHSIRRGALHELLYQGVRLEQIRTLSRHSCINALVRYLPAAELQVAKTTATLSRGLRVSPPRRA
eukprot:TRINITY_DN11742_c0_g1_i2.p1 TRINITY_DN11742_c0_g1~~TRINITY_DN11742_c0_g1_i2.p1  ORF type:complete len:292 (-),score=20.23 TRINITY_DN11742_c0_g1_i2:202-1077(-)